MWGALFSRLGQRTAAAAAAEAEEGGGVAVVVRVVDAGIEENDGNRRS